MPSLSTAGDPQLLKSLQDLQRRIAEKCDERAAVMAQREQAVLDVDGWALTAGPGGARRNRGIVVAWFRRLTLTVAGARSSTRHRRRHA